MLYSLTNNPVCQAGMLFIHNFRYRPRRPSCESYSIYLYCVVVHGDVQAS